ncbi:hypothetical protein MPSEU_000634100 [Mayamaea pseudoterrestris]|nr:hypothetical protein MPSEU_000634100 [Mayamaea pseudoterrestris]
MLSFVGERLEPPPRIDQLKRLFNDLHLALIMKIRFGNLLYCLLMAGAECFVACSSSLLHPSTQQHQHLGRHRQQPITISLKHLSTKSDNENSKDSTSDNGNENWDGNVASNAVDGKMRGCSLQLVEGSMVDWVVTIDGVEADLGRFSEAVYKKVLKDGKRQSFQGFKPGTIPPHLEPTYRAFAMDECARETVLEALQQQNVRPFESCRQDMVLESFSIPPATKQVKKKKVSKRKKQAELVDANLANEEIQVETLPVPEWRAFETMKEAIDAGWRPGQSFSFVARGVKGQLVKDDSPAATGSSLPLGIAQ